MGMGMGEGGAIRKKMSWSVAVLTIPGFRSRNMVALPAMTPFLRFSEQDTTVPFSPGEAVTVRVELWQYPLLPLSSTENGLHSLGEEEG